MHDGLLVLADVTGSSGDTQSVKVALIGLAGVVIVALISLLAGTRRQKLEDDRLEPRLSVRRRLTAALLAQHEAEHDTALAENEAHDLRVRINHANERLRVLERFLYRRRFDPVLIVTGEENPADVRIKTT